MNIREATYHFMAREGLTQKELAALVGVNPCSLSLFLNREHGTTIAEKLAPVVYGAIDLKREGAVTDDARLSAAKGSERGQGS